MLCHNGPCRRRQLRWVAWFRFWDGQPSLAGCPVVWTLTAEPVGGLFQRLQVDTCFMFA